MPRPSPPGSTSPSSVLLSVPDAQTRIQDRPSVVLRHPERLALTLDFAAAEKTGSSRRTHPHVLFSPIHYEPGYAYPLLVWLHGAGEDEHQVMRIMPSISMRNYVAVAPRGTTEEPTADAVTSRTPGDTPSVDISAILRETRSRRVRYAWPTSDEGFWAEFMEAEQRIFDCVSVAQQRCNIASNRVFIGGFGMGGTMALRMALLNPERFAGALSLGGAFPTGNGILHRWSAARSLKIFLSTGGTSTDFSPAEACRSLELLHTAGVSVALREYDCGQELIPAMLQDVNRWMMGIVCE